MDKENPHGYRERQRADINSSVENALIIIIIVDVAFLFLLAGGFRGYIGN